MFLKRVLSIVLTVGILMSTMTGFAVNIDSSAVMTEDAGLASDVATDDIVMLDGVRLAAATSGSISGSSLSWNISTSGMLQISGSGVMPDFVNGGTPWANQAQYIKFAYIADGITNIGAYAFSGMSYMQSIYIPDSVTKIGANAFDGCSKLKEITLPDGLKTIGDNAFKSCSRIKNITIPAGVTSIGSFAFTNCEKLTSIEVDEDNTAYVSEDGVLFTAGLETLVSYPDNKKGASYEVPDGVKAIGPYAFDECERLSEVVLPEGLISIGSGAFYECCDIDEIYIPASVTEIAQDAILYGMESLEAINVDEDNTAYASKDGVLFDKDFTILLRVPPACEFVDEEIGTYLVSDGAYSCSLPISIKVIGQEAFWECRTISKLSVHGSLDRIEMAAFMYFDSLKLIEFGGTRINWDTLQKGIFNEILDEVEITFADGEIEKEVDLQVGVTYYLDKYVDLKGNEVLLETLVVASSDTSVAAVEKTEDSAKLVAISEGTAIITAVVYKDGARYAAAVKVNVTANGDNTQGGTFNLIQDETMDLKDHLIVPNEFLNSLVWTSTDTSVATVENGVVTAVGAGKTFIIASVNKEGNDGYSIRCEVVVEPKYTSEEYFKFNASTGTITEYTGPDSEVIIPPTIGGVTVKAIGQDAFRNCTHVTKVELTESITKIDAYAFYGCSNLVNIKLHDGITYIGNYAFAYCLSLLKITLPSTLTGSGRYVFEGCTRLDIVTFAEGTKTIYGTLAYSQVKKVVIPSTVTTISDTAFYYCNRLEEVKIPNSVNTIGTQAFSGCTKLKSIQLGTGLRTIKDSAFYNCYSLKTITISAGVTSIGNYAFEGCTSLTSISIPDGLTTLGSGAFYNCYSLQSIKIPDGLKKVSDYTFVNCSALTKVNFGTGVQTIGYGAFYYCSGLKEIVLPDTVKSLGEQAFYFCSGLKNLNLGNGLSSIGAGAFSGCTALESVKVSGKISYLGNVFSGCSNLKSVELGDGIVTIGSNAFSNCTALESIVIPDTVTTVGNYAFNGCSKLKTVTFGKNVNVIGDYAFYGCSLLNNVVIPDGVTQISSYTFAYCNNLKEITLGTGVKNIMNYAFRYCSSLKKVEVKGSLEEIGYYAFENCTALEDISLGNKLRAIHPYAFRYCSSLKEVYIPDSVTYLGDYAYGNCSALNDLHIGSGLTTIGYGAFQYCTSLTSIYIPDNIEEIGDYAFYRCTKLQDIDLGYGVKNIKRYAFYYCSSIENIVIPESTSNIGDYAFAYCKKLSTVAIQNPACVLGYNVFYGCSNLNSTADWKASYKVLNEEAVGYFPMQIDYSIEGVLVTDKKIKINLPKDTRLVNGTMKLNGNLYYDFKEEEADDHWTEDYNRIIINIDNNNTSGVFTFCIQPTSYGSFSTTATMTMKQIGEEKTKQIGSVYLSMPEVTLNAPDTTGKSSVVVEGSAIPGEYVKISVDGTSQKQVKATTSGKYKTTVNLSNPVDHKKYKITAQVKETIAEATVEYVANTPNLEKLTYYYGRTGSTKRSYVLYTSGNVERPVIQWGNPGAIRDHGKGYDYYFEVNLSQRSNVDKVYVVSSKDNKKEYLEAVWNSTKGCYVTNGYFANDWNYMPGTLTVEYTKKKDASSASVSDVEAYMDFKNGDFVSSIMDFTSTSFDAEVAVSEELSDLFGERINISSNTIDRDYSGTSVDALCPPEANYYAYPLKKDGKQFVICFDLRSMEDATIVVHNMTDGKETTYLIRFAGADSSIPVIDVMDRANEYAGRISGAYNIDFNVEKITEGLQLSGLSIGTIENGIKRANLMELKKQMFIMMATVLSASGMEGISAPREILDYILALIEEDVAFFKDLKILNIFKIGLECKVKWVIDPSGYVYEGVTDNRLSGVTATIYYSADPNGSNPVLWDAEEYNQKNPLITGEDGMYQWDVPPGYWQVKYEKEGYETTFSEWLPVPPPQLEVNVELVSKEAPKVENVTLTTSALTVEFDKYMIPETITNVTVGNASYTLEYDQTKKDLEGNILAKVFTFKFNTPISGGVEHAVNISGAKSYADVAMDNYSSKIVASGTATYKFIAEDGTVVKELTTDCGTVIVAPETAPQKAAEAQFIYTFAGWDGYTEGMVLTGDISFKAQYTAEIKKHTYKFVNDDGTTVIKEETVDYGTTIIAPDVNPSKAPTSEYSYTFTDWDGYSAGMTATEDLTFVALYSARSTQFTYEFRNDDGSIIASGTLQDGEVIVAPPTPVKSNAEEGYIYNFEGWEGYTVGMSIRANMVFTAKYSEGTIKKCTYTFLDEEGNVIKTDTINYNMEIVAPQDPVKVSEDPSKVYTFAGWFTADLTMFEKGTKATEDITYSAIFNESTAKYTYKFIYDGRNVKDGSLDYGVTIKIKDSDVAVTKEPSNGYEYIFKGWFTESGIKYERGKVAVTENIIFYPVFDAVRIPLDLSVSDVSVNGNEVSISYTNNTETGAYFDVIFAEYDGDILVKIEKKSVAGLENGQTEEKVFTLSDSNNSFKMFTWTSFGDIIPLVKK